VIAEQIKENRAKWIKALSSGRYRQAEGILRHIDHGRKKYCCLGVACQISRLGKWNEQDIFTINGESSDVCLKRLPSVRRWLGMSMEQNSKAVKMNDEDCLSFKQIAECFKGIWRMK